MNSIWKWAGLFILMFASFVIGGALSHSFNLTWDGKADLQYQALINIILTALAVMITVLAIFLATLGVLGWNSIARGVQERANAFLDTGFGENGNIRALVNAQVRDNAQIYLEKQFAEDGDMRSLVRDQVEEFIYAGVNSIGVESDVNEKTGDDE